MLQDQLSKLPNAIWVQIYKDKMQLMDNEGTIVQTIVPPFPMRMNAALLPTLRLPQTP